MPGVSCGAVWLWKVAAVPTGMWKVPKYGVVGFKVAIMVIAEGAEVTATQGSRWQRESGLLHGAGCTENCPLKLFSPHVPAD